MLGSDYHLIGALVENWRQLDPAFQTLRNAENLESLLGQNRLARVQHHLVELLNYVEGKEGYSLLAGERKRCVEQMPLAPAEDEKSLPGTFG